jgi:hypothetical protein
MTTDTTQRHYLKTLARLRRVNKPLSQWDTHELMPVSVRPGVVPPLLGREQLKSLRLMLTDELAALDLL